MATVTCLRSPSAHVLARHLQPDVDLAVELRIELPVGQ